MYVSNMEVENILQRQGQNSDHGHIMMLHTHIPYRCPHQKYQLPTPYSFRDTA